jgi:ComF family protein
MVDEPIAENTQRFQRVHRLLRLGWHQFVDVLTPPLCLCCQAPVTRGAALCLACWPLLHMLDDPVCDALGTPFAYDEGAGALSAAAIAEPPVWNRARAAVLYDETAKGLVHGFKYRDVMEAGLLMARLMQGAGRRLLAEADVVVPVPLHRWRLWRRRFNQAAFLAQQVAVGADLPWAEDVLLRAKPTASQVGMTAEQRHKNVGRAFVVSPERRFVVDGKRVLLVDDVRTTGATAGACADTLRKAGAAQVDLLTFALVLNPAQLHIET